jgi:hemerythrin-like metal-binding protein
MMMPALPWSQEYRINVEVLDAQHRRLATLVERMSEQLAADRTTDAAEETLSELLRVTRLHFATEEELMLKYGFPGYAEHRAEHKRLLFELETLLAAVADSQDGDAKRDVDEHWVLQHLLSQDAELGAFLNDRGIY